MLLGVTAALLLAATPIIHVCGIRQRVIASIWEKFDLLDQGFGVRGLGLGFMVEG